MTDFFTADAGIRQLYARYADAVWRKDYTAVGKCYADQGEWRIEGRICRGRMEVVKHLEETLAQFKRVLITLSQPVLDIGEGTATARTYSTEQAVFHDGRSLFAMGTYFDRLVEEDGKWYFGWRLFETNYAGPSDLSGSFFDNLDHGSPPAMPSLVANTIDLTGTHPQ